MKKSVNKSFLGNSKKFYNVYKGKNSGRYFFLFPCIGISQKKNLHWDMTIKSYFFAWGYSFIQYNVCEVVGDASLELTKENFESLKKLLKSSNITIVDLPVSLKFIKNNMHIVQLLKNSNLEHPYVKKIIYGYFQNQPFTSTI
ncbi:hypothetical protein GW796_00300 [archaeon]|nr:hypothetical protein [archaeon]